MTVEGRKNLLTAPPLESTQRLCRRFAERRISCVKMFWNNRSRSPTFVTRSCTSTMISRTLLRSSRLLSAHYNQILPRAIPRISQKTTLSSVQKPCAIRSYATKTTADEKIEEIQELYPSTLLPSPIFISSPHNFLSQLRNSPR